MSVKPLKFGFRAAPVGTGGATICGGELSPMNAPPKKPTRSSSRKASSRAVELRFVMVT